MAIIFIPPDKIVKAKYSEAFSICIWGQPKMTVRCGHCNNLFATRDYKPDRETRECMAHCPSCNYWNKTGLRRD